MKNKNDQAERKADAPVAGAREKAKAHDNRQSRWDAPVPNLCGPGLGGIFAGRPPMWHPVPNIF